MPENTKPDSQLTPDRLPQLLTALGDWLTHNLAATLHAARPAAPAAPGNGTR
jgi:hypothetical protein